ncbi:hypothetical protein V2A60_006641 [Cordyceps javanica]
MNGGQRQDGMLDRGLSMESLQNVSIPEWGVDLRSLGQKVNGSTKGGSDSDVD